MSENPSESSKSDPSRPQSGFTAETADHTFAYKDGVRVYVSEEQFQCMVTLATKMRDVMNVTCENYVVYFNPRLPNGELSWNLEWKISVRYTADQERLQHMILMRLARVSRGAAGQFIARTAGQAMKFERMLSERRRELGLESKEEQRIDP